MARNDGAGAAWWQRQQRIIAAAKSAGLPRGAMALLRVMLEAETGRNQTIIRARETLADAMGAHIDTVDRNMKTLVAAGVVEKLYSKGGQHKANVYRVKEISPNLPQNAVGNVNQGDYLPQNADLPPAFCGNTSRKMRDPSYSSYLSEEERRGAGRAADGGKGPSGTLTAEQRADAAMLARAMKEAGTYGGAKALVAQWKREAAGGDC